MIPFQHREPRLRKSESQRQSFVYMKDSMHIQTLVTSVEAQEGENGIIESTLPSGIA